MEQALRDLTLSSQVGPVQGCLCKALQALLQPPAHHSGSSALQEADRITRAFQDPQFGQLLGDYMSSLADPQVGDAQSGTFQFVAIGRNLSLQIWVLCRPSERLTIT